MQETGNGCYPASFFTRLTALGVGHNRQRIAEFGAGGDGLSRALARLGARVTVVDADAARLGNARRLALAENIVLDYHEAAAEDTGLAAGAWEAVVVGEAWRRLDRPAALVEAARLLKPGGLLAACYVDPLPGRDVVACTADELLMKYRPGWVDPGGDGRISGVPQWLGADFELAAMFSYRERLPFTRDRWHAQVVARGGIGDLDEETAARFDAEHARLLAVVAPGDSPTVLHAIGAHLVMPMEKSE